MNYGEHPSMHNYAKNLFAVVAVKAAVWITSVRKLHWRILSYASVLVLVKPSIVIIVFRAPPRYPPKYWSDTFINAIFELYAPKNLYENTKVVSIGLTFSEIESIALGRAKIDATPPKCGIWDNTEVHHVT